jgi:hypothetical protein
VLSLPRTSERSAGRAATGSTPHTPPAVCGSISGWRRGPAVRPALTPVVVLLLPPPPPPPPSSLPAGCVAQRAAAGGGGAAAGIAGVGAPPAAEAGVAAVPGMHLDMSHTRRVRSAPQLASWPCGRAARQVTCVGWSHILFKVEIVASV